MNNLSSTLHLLLYFIGSILLSSITLYIILQSPFSVLFRDKPDPRKIHQNPIPRLGGIIFIVTFILLLITALLSSQLSRPLATNSPTLFSALFFASILTLIIGFLDDTNFITVRVRHKLATEIAIAFVTVYVLDINIGNLSLLGFYSLPLWFSNFISVLWIIGLANAYNFVDGLDGLAGMLALTGIFSLGIIAGIGNQFSIIFITLLLSGSIIGFLIHNFPPARTFMGDTGSIFLGTIIAILTLYIGREVVPTKALIAMPLIAGIPIIEVLITMMRRFFQAKNKKKSFMKSIHSMVIPDNAHIHHRLTYKGYSTSQSVLLLSIVSITLCCGAISSILIPVHYIPIIIVYISIPVYLILYQLGYSGQLFKALHLSPTPYISVKKSSLIGVIDQEGSFSQKLEQQIVEGISYIKISENDILSLHHHLRAAVVRELKTNPDMVVKKAEKISSILRGPVFIIQDTENTNMMIRKVSKNGSLTIKDKTASIHELLKDFQKLSTTEKIKHYHNNSSDNLKHEQINVC